MKRITALIIAIFVISFASTPVFAGVQDISYRDVLSLEQQALYDQFYERAQKHDGSWFTVNSRMNIDEVDEVFTAFFADNPEFYWLEYSGEYRYGRDSTVSMVKTRLAENNESYKANLAHYFDCLHGAIEDANRFETDREKIYYICITIIYLCEYDKKCPLNQSPFSVFGLNKSVCAGYARAFKQICDAVGIPCWYIRGFAGRPTWTVSAVYKDGHEEVIATSGDNLGLHAWNVAIIDGELKFFDLTWDDLDEYGRGVNYCGLTLDEISRDHFMDETSKQLINKISAEISD